MRNLYQKRFKFSYLSGSMIFKFLILLCVGLNPTSTFAADTTLKIQYASNNNIVSNIIPDETGNGYDATLQNGAILKKLGRFNIIDLGLSNGFLDLGSKTGTIIQSLSDFTIALNVYVDPSVVLTNAGNFIWTFANSSNMGSTSNGNMFFTALNTRYAISKTNYNAESSVSRGTALSKGSWKNVTYTQEGTTGTVYIDGVNVKSKTITLLPSALGATSTNYIGRSCYTGDAYLTNSLINDFRVYNRALPATEVAILALQRTGLDSAMIIQQVADAGTRLILPGLNAVISNISLPTDGGNSVVISWNSSNPGYITNSGIVTRPVSGSDTAVVQLTATLSKNGVEITKLFTAKVVPSLSDRISAQQDSSNLSISGSLNLLRSNLSLSTKGIEGSAITWSSDKPSILSSAGFIVNRPAKGAGNVKVTLTATIIKGSVTITKIFTINVAEDEGFSAYLFAYFTGNTGNQEAIRFALSDDGFIYNALNGNNPVLNSATISTTGGVRDPHILRGQNNDYFMVATDMVSAQGWSSNRAMVLLKSTNMIDWQSSVVNIPNLYPEYSAADEVWAPQTIYDPQVGKYMVYFAMRLGSSDFSKIYYAYANSTFTAFESSPKLLFNNNGLSTIDADIVLKDGIYNMFFKTEGNGNGIKRAYSPFLTGGYVLYDKYLQSTSNAVEGSCTFRIYNSDNWILMYDMYTSGAYQFTTSTDLINFSVVPDPVSFDFTPRHGTVIPITATEKQALIKKWNPTMDVNKVSGAKAISIYPNPVKETLYYSCITNEHTLKLSVLDLNGNEIIQRTIANEKGQLDVSGLSPGIYLLKIISTEGVLNYQKFIKQ